MKKREALTVEKLREMTGLTLTDEEAEDMLRSIQQIAKIFIAVTFPEESQTKASTSRKSNNFQDFQT